MPTIEINTTHEERLEALRAEIEAERKAPYTSVTISNVLTYLLDLSDTVEDPDRSVTPIESEDAPDEFPRDALRDELHSRNRKDNNPADTEKMDLYSIAAAYDITGRSRMTKSELITTVLDEAESRYSTPFAGLDLTLPDQLVVDEESETDTSAKSPETPDADETDANSPSSTATGSDTTETSSLTSDLKQAANDTSNDSPDSESGQLNAMLSLLETHDDKWWSTDGEARYEVELPDGTCESARTKDDVRALLFKNY